MNQRKIKNIYFLKIVRIILMLWGIFCLLILITAFTTLPYWGIHWLGTSRAELNHTPETIILLGGSGMPSESNLMRCWYTAQASDGFPEADILIAMPGKISDSLDTPQLVKKELVLRSVEPEKIFFENTGTNTRAQALNSLKLLNASKPVLIVTSPEHTRRAVLSFRKAGFEKVNALPAFENASETDFRFTDDELGGNKLPVPDVGHSMQLRYQVWNHLKYEITFIREVFALTYYKLRGWV